MSIFVTGHSGNVGREVVNILVKNQHSFFVGAQGGSTSGGPFKTRLLDYNDATTFGPALINCDQIFLMYPPQVKLENFQAFINSLKFSSIKHIVYLSVKDVSYLPFIPHYKNEKLIQRTGIPFTFIRAGYFMQNLNLFLKDDIIQNHKIIVPAGKGKTGFTDIRDVANSVVFSLENHTVVHNQAYTITGSESMNFFEVASRMSLILPHTIHYTNPSIREFKSYMLQKGLDSSYVNVVANLHIPTKLRLAGGITKEYQTLTGKKPTTLNQYISDYQHVWR